MDNSSLSDSINLIKHQFASQEQLLKYHSKIDALIELILAKDVFIYPTSKLHDCLLIIGDLICIARKLNKESMNSLCRIIAVLINLKMPTK